LKKICYIVIISFICIGSISAQRFADQVPQTKRYIQKDIVDPVEGIKMYNRLVEAIGGDSINYNKAGYNLQGWNEDYYMSGKLLHRGYYIDGRAIVFKNYFTRSQARRLQKYRSRQTWRYNQCQDFHHHRYTAFQSPLAEF
jgi:hypothetical protein